MWHEALRYPNKWCCWIMGWIMLADRGDPCPILQCHENTQIAECSTAATKCISRIVFNPCRAKSIPRNKNIFAFSTICRHWYGTGHSYLDCSLVTIMTAYTALLKYYGLLMSWRRNAPKHLHQTGKQRESRTKWLIISRRHFQMYFFKEKTAELFSEGIISK